MIIKSPTLESRYRRRVCVAGTGLGGATVALNLMRQGVRDLIVVEAGTFGVNAIPRATETGREFGLPVTRVMRVGGTSNVWGGVCAPFDASDFSIRTWFSDASWPISRDELEPHYLTAAGMLGLYDPQLYERAKYESSFGEQIRMMPYNRQCGVLKLFQYNEQPLSYESQLREAFSSDEGVSDNGPLMLLNCSALKVEYSVDRGQVVGLTCGVAGGLVRIDCDLLVVALGALETPRLLLNSNNGGNTAPSGNGHIGRNLMDHPMGNFFQVRFRNPLKSSVFHRSKFEGGHCVKVGLRIKESTQRQLGIGNNLAYLIPSFAEGVHDRSEKVKRSLIAFRARRPSIADLLTIVRYPNVALQILQYLYGSDPTYSLADVWCVTEQAPAAANWVDLSEIRDEHGFRLPRIHWSLTRHDLDHMLAYYDALQELFPADAFEVLQSRHEIRWHSLATSAAHHMGTARMAATERNGVVDSNLKVFGISNLYVCDASVIPVGGNANPGMTVVALGLRLAKHLAAALWMPQISCAMGPQR